MFYENEFGLLQDTLKKLRIEVHTVATNETTVELIDDSIRSSFQITTPDITIDSLLNGAADKTLYRLRDHLGFAYSAFLLPNVPNRAVFLGPYLCEPFSVEKVLEVSERNGFSPQKQRVINEYFRSVPVVPENSTIHLMIEAFCERMWNGDFSVSDITDHSLSSEPSAVSPAEGTEFDDTFLDMKNMERRYQMENEIMDAVMLGSEHKLKQIFSAFTDNFFEVRVADPLRNSKNYCIIMNTLLRKSAERGGVHPMYLNKISSRFALQIEQLPSADKVKILMEEMFRSYCRLVSKHTSKNYSPIVQKAVIAIESNPSAELNLRRLAEKLNVSNVYLSSVFKKETGKTITQYIRHKRLTYAEYLLENTNLQVQTVALHCGMVDIHYFSKQFKRHTGMTPSAYRAEKGATRIAR